MPGNKEFVLFICTIGCTSTARMTTWCTGRSALGIVVQPRCWCSDPTAAEVWPLIQWAYCRRGRRLDRGPPCLTQSLHRSLSGMCGNGSLSFCPVKHRAASQDPLFQKIRSLVLILPDGDEEVEKLNRGNKTKALRVGAGAREVRQSHVSRRPLIRSSFSSSQGLTSPAEAAL